MLATVRQTARLRSLLAPALAISLAGCTGANGQSGAETKPKLPPSAPTTTATVDHSGWDDILRQTVHEERVNYPAIRARHAAALASYLDRLATVEVSGLKRDEQLAYYINLYNATMVHAIADRLRDGYTVAADDYAIFKQPLVRLAERTVSCDELEKKIALPTFDDPRLHVAFVCGAVSCPPLLPRAYRGNDVDQVLDQNMRRFVADPNRNQIDPKNQRMQLSSLFDWYAQDFGGKGAVPGYINRYWDGDDVDGYAISFLEYSWELNATKQ